MPVPPKGAGVVSGGPRRGIPTQAIILALVAVLVIPGVLFSGLLLDRYAESQRAQISLQGMGVARAAATALDRHLTDLQTTLQTLSTSELLVRGDLEGFHRQAVRVKEFIGADIVLRGLDGRQVVNTRLPWGADLPVVNLPVDARAIDTGQPVISDIFTGAIAGRPLVAIILALNLNAERRYLLNVSMETERFRDVVTAALPEDWLIGVGDRRGTYVTRTEGHAQFSGKPGVPAFLARASAHEGSFVGESLFGNPVLVGYTHTAASNWLVAASIRLDKVEEPLRRGLLALLGFGGAVLLLASAVALWLWRFVARPLQGLALASRRLASREAPPTIETSLREFAEVRDALLAAAEQVRLHNEELEARVAARTAELERANADLSAQMAAREAAESQLRQIQKMEAVGQLTGGIAHDFNNMLAIIIGSLNLLRRRLDRGPEETAPFVDSGLEGAKRAAALTSRLLAFSRQQPLAPAVLDLNRLVAGMTELLQRTLGQTIEIETVLAAGLWKTFADGPQVESAILNLSVNARDAMPEGGRLTIETANAFLDEAYVAAHHGVRPGQYVQLCVSDTGGGMSEEVMARAFDPFFTTKKTGLGTGLGLSQVYGFVRQSGGHIKIYSEAGHGTSIKIYLPRHYGGDETVASPRSAAGVVHPGRPEEVILVVEDEGDLRQLTVASLKELGYGVLDSGSGKEALGVLEAHPEVRLLFTDIVMPEMNGRQLADRALARRPDLKVLFTTGFTRNAVVHNGILDTGVNLLAKPFTLEDLSAKIRQVLAGE